MTRNPMKNIALSLLTLALLTSCAGDRDRGDRGKVGINLGKQSAQITLAAGNNNDVNITGTSGNTTTYIRFLVNAAGSTLTGMDRSLAGVVDGDQFIIRNDSAAGSLTITNEDALSVATNRFLTAGAVSIVIQPRSSVMVEWDSTAVRWMAHLVAPANPTFTGNVSANGGNIPVLSTCGTSPSIVATSTGFAGTFTTGSGATTCTLTFATAFTAAPTCIVVSAASAAVLIPTYSTSATALTLSVDIASTAYQYVCVGH